MALTRTQILEAIDSIIYSNNAQGIQAGAHNGLLKAFIDYIDASVVAPVAGTLTSEVYEIGDWNMDADVAKSVIINIPGGDAKNRVKHISVVIRPDADVAEPNERYFLNRGDASGGISGFVNGFNDTTVSLYRQTSGSFDSVSYDSTSYNRGWVTIWYETT